MKIFAADLSLRLPGFALLNYNEDTGQVTVQKKSNVNNKTNKKKCHGEILMEISSEIHSYLAMKPDIIVRQEAIAGVPKGSTPKVNHILGKVVGLSDILAWADMKREWDEIPPKTVKKLITGNPNAQKDIVADKVQYWIGQQTFEVDDESDACAVGVAWLLTKGYISDDAHAD